MATNIPTVPNFQARVPIVDPQTGQPSKDFLQKLNQIIKALNALRVFVDTEHP